MLQELGDGTTYGTSAGFATYYLSTGDIDAAANWLEKAIAQRLPIAPVMMRSPLARGLRASARWPGLARMMNLPEVIA